MPNNTHDELTPAYAAHLPIRYPTNAVLGVLDSRAEVLGAVAELNDAGFWTSEIEVASGDVAAKAVHNATGRTGLPGMVLRFAQWLGLQDEELEHKSHYEHAMRDGHFVVVVRAPSERRKLRATQLLRKWGAHSLSFHGRFTIEEMSRSRYA